MIIGYLLVGIITAVFSAGIALFLGYGLLIAFAAYVAGGMIGMGVMLALLAFRRPRALPKLLAVEG